MYINDFVYVAQGGVDDCMQVRRHLFHAINAVFWPNGLGDGSAWQEMNSLKKLRQGDAAWSIHKKVLGWLHDTVAMTVSLLAMRAIKVHAALEEFNPCQRHTLAQKWHRLLGLL